MLLLFSVRRAARASRKRRTGGSTTAVSFRRRRDDLIDTRRRPAPLVSPDPVEPLRAGRLLLSLGDHTERFHRARHDDRVAAVVADDLPFEILHRAEVDARLAQHAPQGA